MLYVGTDLVAQVRLIRQALDVLAMLPPGSRFELRNDLGHCLRAGYA